VEPNEIQLRRLLEALRQELAFQWLARYIEVLPGGVLVLSFEHTTNRNWRCLYTIKQSSEWIRREFYV
jgi:hypothetical protein